MSQVLKLVLLSGVVQSAVVRVEHDTESKNVENIVSIDGGKYNRTVSYEGQQILRCRLDERVSEQQTQKLMLDFDIVGSGPQSVDLRTRSREQSMTISNMFDTNVCQVLIDDLEASVRLFEKDLELSRSNKNSLWFEAYHTYDEIIGWYTDMADAYPEITQLVPSIGESTEGRAMPAFHVRGTGGMANKKKVYFQCQIHAREWISGATCMYIVNHLTENYGIDPEVTDLLNKVELIVVPFANPDGYAYTWTSSRLWRKNRSPNVGSACVGTDLNRNFDDHWGEGGSSSDPCSDTFMGPSAGSEQETKNVVEYFLSHRPIYGAIDWHSYSQLILRPYGWSRNDAPDETKLKEIGDIMKDESERVHGMRYVSQKSISLYPTTGTANDWFYGDDAGNGGGSVRTYGFTLELRDTGRFGFELPASEIIPQGQEMIGAAMSFMKYTTENPLVYPAKSV